MFKNRNNFKLIKKIISTTTALGIMLTAMAGISVNKVSAQTENVLWLDGALNNQWIGQRVSLEEGKTYEFSYYSTPGNNCSPEVYKDKKEGAISSIKTQDDDYMKITAKFTVPSDAIDDGNGKKSVWVGIRTGAPRSQYEYCARFNLCDITDVNTNLLNDAGLTIHDSYYLDKTIWKTPYDAEYVYGFWVRPISEIGGMDAFKRPDGKSNVLWIGADLSNQWFGQQVALEEGKTYEFSYYYTPGNNSTPCVYKNLSEGAISSTKTQDSEYLKLVTKFTVPSDAMDDGNGKKLVWVGIRTGAARAGYEYCGKFNLYNVENPSTNLLKDSGMAIQGSYDLNTSIWKTAYGGGLPYGFWVRAIAEIGGIDAFKRTEAKSNALWIGGDSANEWVGQQVALDEGKTYEFSYYYTKGNNCTPSIYKNLREGVIESVKTQDLEYLKVTSRFTVPADALDNGNGKKLVWVGIRTGAARSQYEYCYKFNLSNIENPSANLLNDSGLAIQGDYDLNTGIWKSAYGDNISSNFWIIAVSKIGGLNAFARPMVKVTFNSMSGSEVPAQDAYSGIAFTAPADPTKGGAIFRGWYTDDTYSAKWNFDVDNTSTDITLVAKWLLKGDANNNGSIDVIDLVRIKKHLANTQVLTDDELLASKISGGETVSANDLILLKKYLLKLTDIL